MRKLLLLIPILMIAAQCGSIGGEKVSEGNLLRRTIDREAGVVCWHFERLDGGVSCLPISETKLGD